MSDKNQVKRTEKPLIVDTNKDGILQGSELRAQLRAEEEAGFYRTANETVHGILEAAGMKGMARLYAHRFLEAQLTADPKGNIAALNTNAAENVGKQLSHFLEKVSKRSVSDLEAVNTQLQINPEIADHERARVISDNNNMYAFAQQYKHVFPKGIELKAEDMQELMAHFQQLPVVVPRMPAPATRQQDRTRDTI